MRPANPKHSSLRARARRVRTQANVMVGWASGWPVDRAGDGVVWRSLDGVRTVDRETLHQTIRTLTNLEDRHRDIVDRTLPEGKSWRTRVPHLVDLLKPVLHDDAPLPADTLDSPAWSARAVRQIEATILRHPRLAAHLRRATWAYFLRPQRLRQHLEELPTTASALESLACMEDEVGWFHRAWLLAERAPPTLVAEAIEQLTRQQRHDLNESALSTSGSLLQLVERSLGRRARRDSIRWPEQGAPDRFMAIESWARTWCDRSERELRRTLTLWTTCWPEEHLHAQARWYRELCALAADAKRNLFRPRRHSRHHHAHVRLVELTARRKTLFQPRSTTVPPKRIAQDFDALVTLPPKQAASVDILIAQAARWAQPQQRAEWIRLLHQTARDNAQFFRRLARWLTTLDERSLRAFWNACESLADMTSTRVVAAQPFLRQVEVMVELHARGLPHRPGLGEMIYAATPAWSCTSIVADVLQSLIDAGSEPTSDPSCFLLLAEDTGLAPAELVALELDPDAHHFAVALHRAGFAVAEMLRDPPCRHRLVFAARRWRRLPAAQQAVHIPTSTPDDAWIEAWPESLQPVLAELAAVHPNAQRCAAHVVRQRFRPPHSLMAELRWLECHPDRAARAERVRRQLATPPSARTLGWARRKLRHACLLATLDAITHHIDRHWVQRVQDLFGIHPDEVDLPDPKRARLFGALVEQRSTVRNLAARILQRRRSDPAANLHDLPGNATWIAQQTRAGLDLSPWLQPAPPISVMTPDGTTLSLGIETDPLELFWMGSHFQTCLSVGAPNFFSVISNIADANKVVVYGRDDEGTVVARCLFALDTYGNILTFHAFARPGIEFDMMAYAFAADLARAMGTAVSSAGKVLSLVAPDWYDDGTRDLADVPSAMAEGGSLHQTLRQGTPVEVHDKLRREFGPRYARSLLQVLLTVPAVRSRPDLLQMWFDELLRAPEKVWTQGVVLLAEHERPHLARELLSTHIKDAQRDPRFVGRCTGDFLDAAIGLSPNSMMAVFRRATHQDVYGRGRAHYWLGRGLETQFRQAAAREQYRAALGMGLHREEYNDAERRLQS